MARRWLAALASASRHRLRRRRLAIRGTLVILAIVHVAIDPAVTILVGPNCTGKSTDDGAGNGAFKQADARDQRTGGTRTAPPTHLYQPDGVESRPRATLLIRAVLAVPARTVVVVSDHTATGEPPMHHNDGALAWRTQHPATTRAANGTDRGPVPTSDIRASSNVEKDETPSSQPSRRHKSLTNLSPLVLSGRRQGLGPENGE